MPCVSDYVTVYCYNYLRNPIMTLLELYSYYTTQSSNCQAFLLKSFKKYCCNLVTITNFENDFK